MGIIILLDTGLEDVRIPCLEARDQIPWHQFAEQDPIHLLPVDSPSVFSLSGPRVILDLVPEGLDPAGEFLERYSWLQVQGKRYLSSIEKCLDALPAHLETDGSFYASVSEINVSELCLGDTTVVGYGQVDILEFHASQCLSRAGHRGLAVDMSLHRGLLFSGDLITSRDKGGQGRKAGYNLVTKETCPFVTITCRAGHRVR